MGSPVEPPYPFFNLPIGTLQEGLRSRLSEEELNEFAFLHASLSKGSGALSANILSDKLTLAALYKILTLEQLPSQGYRRGLLMAMTEDHVYELAALSGGGPYTTPEAAVDGVLTVAWSDSPVWRRFLALADLPVALLPKPSEGFADLMTCTPYDPPLNPLFDYQVGAFQRVFDHVLIPNARVLLQMPTGSGKTRTAMEVACAFLRARLSTGGPARVVWVCHVAELCEQAVAQFDQVWKHTGSQPIPILRVWEQHGVPQRFPSPSFSVVGFQKFVRRLGRYSNTYDADLVVVDEAHVSLAPRYSAVLDLFQTTGTRYLGLTATPGRAQNVSEDTRALARQFGNRLVGLDFGDLPVITALQERGVLSVIDREEVRTELPFPLSEEEWNSVAEEGDYPSAVLQRLARDRNRNLVILEKLRLLAHEGLQTLVFGTSVSQSRMLAAMMLSMGVSACHIDASTPGDVRRAFVDRFRRKEIQLLMNFGVLTTGFDAPQVDCVFISRPTTSVVLYSQMIGRGLRGPAVGGTATCRLVDVVDNFLNMPGDIVDVYDYFTEYWSEEA